MLNTRGLSSFNDFKNTNNNNTRILARFQNVYFIAFYLQTPRIYYSILGVRWPEHRDRFNTVGNVSGLLLLLLGLVASSAPVPPPPHVNG